MPPALLWRRRRIETLGPSKQFSSRPRCVVRLNHRSSSACYEQLPCVSQSIEPLAQASVTPTGASSLVAARAFATGSSVCVAWISRLSATPVGYDAATIGKNATGGCSAVPCLTIRALRRRVAFDALSRIRASATRQCTITKASTRDAHLSPIRSGTSQAFHRQFSNIMSPADVKETKAAFAKPSPPGTPAPAESSGPDPHLVYFKVS